MIRYLDRAGYEANAVKDDKWRSHKARWPYHVAAIATVESLGIKDAGEVLEIGAFGAQIVIGSDTMDLPQGDWEIPGARSTYAHDARELPWPIKTGRYSLVVALRVWHHLFPRQKECFLEAKRVAKHVLIVCPEKEIVGVGIRRRQWDDWNGSPPIRQAELEGWGRLYLFKGGLNGNGMLHQAGE